MMIDSSSSTSTRPYLLRAMYEWCVDNGLTPYVAAFVDDTVKVPREYVKNNEIVLNISMDATSNLQISNDYLQFKARFAGTAREIAVPISHVIAIYARENGQGMAFPVPQAVPPRGEVLEPEPKNKRSAGLHSVPAAPTSSTSTEQVAVSDATPEATEASAHPAPKVITLKPNSTASADPASDDHDPPPDAPPPASGNKSKGSRPALTRIK
jgi:stringent starvation protein B